MRKILDMSAQYAQLWRSSSRGPAAGRKGTHSSEGWAEKEEAEELKKKLEAGACSANAELTP